MPGALRLSLVDKVAVTPPRATQACQLGLRNCASSGNPAQIDDFVAAHVKFNLDFNGPPRCRLAEELALGRLAPSIGAHTEMAAALPPTATDDFGHTPLMLACEVRRKPRPYLSPWHCVTARLAARARARASSCCCLQPRHHTTACADVAARARSLREQAARLRRTPRLALDARLDCASLGLHQGL